MNKFKQLPIALAILATLTLSFSLNSFAGPAPEALVKVGTNAVELVLSKLGPVERDLVFEQANKLPNVIKSIGKLTPENVKNIDAKLVDEIMQKVKLNNAPLISRLAYINSLNNNSNTALDKALQKTNSEIAETNAKQGKPIVQIVSEDALQSSQRFLQAKRPIGVDPAKITEIANMNFKIMKATNSELRLVQADIEPGTGKLISTCTDLDAEAVTTLHDVGKRMEEVVDKAYLLSNKNAERAAACAAPYAASGLVQTLEKLGNTTAQAIKIAEMVCEKCRTANTARMREELARLRNGGKVRLATELTSCPL